MPKEPLYVPPIGETKARIRRWLQYHLAHYTGEMKQGELADALGVSPTTISQLKHEMVNPGLKTFVAMHFVFGADLVRMVRNDPPITAEAPTTADRLRQKLSR